MYPLPMTFYGPPASWYEPPDEPIFRCSESGDMNEDCPLRDEDDLHECEPVEYDGPDYEPDDVEPYDWGD